MNRPQNIENYMNGGAICVCTYVVGSDTQPTGGRTRMRIQFEKSFGRVFFIVIKHFCNKISVCTEMSAAGRTDGRILFRGRVARFINFAVGDFTAFCVYLPRPLNFQIEFQICITSWLSHNATGEIVCDCDGRTVLVELSLAQRKPAAPVEIESIWFDG